MIIEGDLLIKRLSTKIERRKIPSFFESNGPVDEKFWL